MVFSGLAVNPSDVYLCFDYDEFLWSLRGRLAKLTSIRLEDWKEYFITDNNFSPQLVERVEDLLRSDFLFNNINFFPDIENIMRPERELGTKVRIVGNVTSKTEIIKKSEQILAAVPEMKEENLDFRLVGMHHKGPKILPGGCLIFGDDLPFYIAHSSAKMNVLPKYSYNTSDKAKMLMRNVPYRYFDTLRDINKYCYEQTLAYLQTGVWEGGSKNA